MKALIFDSGLGHRMGAFTETHHKSMARLGNGETIFGRQLRILAANGISDFVVTTGPFADQLAEVASRPEFAGLNITFVPNPVYDRTNYIYSMYLAREHLDDDVLMLHGDLVFNSALLGQFLADPRPDLGAVNHALPLPEKDFKARLDGDLIGEVSVSVFGADCVAFQPLYKLGRRALDVWLARVAQFVEAGTTGVYAENALNEVSAEAGIVAFSYAEGFVNEVDDLNDLASVMAEIRLFDFAEQPVLDGTDDYLRIPELLASVNAVRPLIVGGQSYGTSFLRSYLDEQCESGVRFTGYSSNPKQEEILAGLRLFREQGCDSIISVGGGSALDVGKCIKILAASGGDDFPSPATAVDRSVAHLAIPTTAGTGSESTHFAVAYVDGEKHSIAHDAMLPDWVLLEPRLLESLPDYHKKASLLDALTQCVESLWATGATEQSRDYAQRGLALLLDNVFAYFHKGVDFDMAVTQRLQQAANLSGRAINLTKTTAPHAMSYKLTSMYGIAHGHAAGLCLRGVWRLYVKLAADGSPRAEPVLAPLELLTRAFESASPVEAVRKLDVILEALRLSAPPLRDPADIGALVSSVNAERLGNSPIVLDATELRLVYEYVFGLRSRPYPMENDEPTLSIQGPRAAGLGDADLASLQSCELQILTAFDHFCMQHNLQYYLSEGSILGAVRHGGFIPWDDDIDVMMPRADFRRFVQMGIEGKLPADLNLDCFTSNPKHWVFGAKLQLTTQTKFHLPRVAHVAQYDGPYIDVFPVDGVLNPSGLRFSIQAILLRALRRALFMSSGRSRGLRKKPLARIPLYLLTRMVKTTTIHGWVTWVQTKFNNGAGAQHWANLCTYYPIDREVFPKEWFGAGKRVLFEGHPFLVPLEAERMLERIYGPDYLQVPGLRLRKARSHAFHVDRGDTGNGTGSSPGEAQPMQVPQA